MIKQAARIISKYSIEVVNIADMIGNIDATYKDYTLRYGVEDDVINNILSKDEQERTNDEQVLLDKRKYLDDWRNEQVKALDIYLPFTPEAYSGDLGEFDATIPYFVEEDGVIVQKWEVVHSPSKILDRIEALVAELAETDYQVIKCYEAALLGSEMPYDTSVLVSERQIKRDEINRLQEMLDKTDADV